MLSSVATVPSNIEKDVLCAEAAGKSHKESFVSERLQAKEHFFEPVKKHKLKIMADSARKVTLKSTQHKVTELRHQGNVPFSSC